LPQPLNLNGVAENFNTSRPAISKHIKILTECGLVVIRQEGRERHCEIKMGKLDEVSSWVEQCRLFWSEKLDNLERFLESSKQAMASPKASDAPKRRLSGKPSRLNLKRINVAGFFLSSHPRLLAII